MVSADLYAFDILENWYELAQDRSQWSRVCIEKCQSNVHAADRHNMVIATSIANVTGPSAAKVISRGKAISVPTTTS